MQLIQFHGQETENIEFLEKKSVAIWAKSPEDVQNALQKLLTDKNYYKKVKQNISLVAKPNSTKEICDILFKDI